MFPNPIHLRHAHLVQTTQGVNDTLYQNLGRGGSCRDAHGVASLDPGRVQGRAIGDQVGRNPFFLADFP